MPILGSFTSGRSFGRSGGGAGVNFAEGGNSIVETGGYRYHYFTGSGTINFATTDPLTPVDILMVGGGGASTQYAGGAGGGEVLVISRILSPGSYPITVGAGGASNGARDSANPGRRGLETTGFGETAKAGGPGLNSDEGVPSGATENGPHPPSGCGGAGSSRTTGYFGVQGTSVGTGVTRYGGTRGGQTNSGSTNDAPNYPGGGGGGAGQSRSGDTGGSGAGGTGGNGIQVGGVGLNYYWGGGGGGAVYYGGTAGPGGLGGGGGGSAGNNAGGGGSAYNTGGSASGSTGGSGGANTGGGGGGGRGQNSGPGGSGGSGIVIVRYPI